MTLGQEMSFPWLCFWALEFPSVALGPIFDKYKTNLVTFALPLSAKTNMQETHLSFSILL